MTLTIQLLLNVEADNESEREQAEKLNAQAQDLSDRQCTTVDLTHVKDICAVMNDLNQIVARARAIRK